jgi:hypothetical protein
MGKIPELKFFKAQLRFLWLGESKKSKQRHEVLGKKKSQVMTSFSLITWGQSHNVALSFAQYDVANEIKRNARSYE